MKFKLNYEEIKTWLIILLIIGLVSSIAYYYIYPWMMQRAFEQASRFLVNYMINQLNEVGKVKINIEGTQIVLIPEEYCNATK